MSFNHLAPAPQLEIGRTVPRIDGLAKACGTERYAVDEYPPNLLWAAVRRAGVPHARIQRVDISQSQSLPGVVRVLTRQDVPGTNRQGILHKDQPVLAGTCPWPGWGPTFPRPTVRPWPRRSCPWPRMPSAADGNFASAFRTCCSPMRPTRRSWRWTS